MKLLIIFSLALLAPISLFSAEKSPNIIVFLADDQGWTGTSVQMDKNRPESKSDFYQTPALERLAEQSMRFSQAYSPHPNCSSTRMSIQTGKSPARLGTTDIYDVNPGTPGFIEPFYNNFYLNKPLIMHLPIIGLPEEEVTIGEFIKKHRPEYTTAHFGKWHMGPKNPTIHGYDVHDGPTTNTEGNAGMPDPKQLHGITHRSVDFIKTQAAADTPFFLMISHYAVHTRIFAEKETIDKYSKLEPGKNHKNGPYAAMTENMDESLATLLQTLDELKLTDDTYLIYTSDNGGEIGPGSTPTNNTPLRKGKTHTWEGGIRVPLIVRGPDIKADSQCNAPVNGSDFFATFVDILDIDAPLPANMDGGSLAGVLRNSGRGKIDRPTEDFVWYYPHYRDFKAVFPQAAIRSGNYKLRKEYDTDRLMLFDLSKDIGETNDLSSSHPDLTKKIHKKLNDYLAEVQAKIPTKNINYDPKKDRGGEQIIFGGRALPGSGGRPGGPDRQRPGSN